MRIYVHTFTHCSMPTYRAWVNKLQHIYNAVRRTWEMKECSLGPDVGKVLVDAGESQVKRCSYSHWYSPTAFLSFDPNGKILKSVLFPIITCQTPLKCLTCLWPSHKPIGQMAACLIQPARRWDLVKLHNFPREQNKKVVESRLKAQPSARICSPRVLTAVVCGFSGGFTRTLIVLWLQDSLTQIWICVCSSECSLCPFHTFPSWLHEQLQVHLLCPNLRRTSSRALFSEATCVWLMQCTKDDRDVTPETGKAGLGDECVPLLSWLHGFK